MKILLKQAFTGMLIVALLAACDGNVPLTQTPTFILPTVKPTEIVATEAPAPLINFMTPQDGTTIGYDEMDFEILPVPNAEGYVWTFIQNGKVIWYTIERESRDFMVRNTAFLIREA